MQSASTLYRHRCDPEVSKKREFRGIFSVLVAFENFAGFFTRYSSSEYVSICGAGATKLADTWLWTRTPGKMILPNTIIENLFNPRTRPLGAERFEDLPRFRETPTPVARNLRPFTHRFRYFYRLGQGGQGVVHLCGDRRHPGCLVAIKVARPCPGARASLAREAKALWALRAASPVPELTGLVYRKSLLCGFVTRYMSGETLEQLLPHCTRSRGRILGLAVSTAESVLEILRRGYLHRDVKPENLLVSRDGRVQILDFGLACTLRESSRERGLSGTLAYASPEQLEGKPLDDRSDLFSLGLVLYEIATGRMFFSTKTKTLRAFLAGRTRRFREPMELDEVEPGLAALVRRLLVPNRRVRADVAEVEERLAELRRCSLAA